MKYSFILPRLSIVIMSACLLWEMTSAFSLNTITKSTTKITTKLDATSSSSDDGFVTPNMDDVGFVVLAGGTGSRMKANMRKLTLVDSCCLSIVYHYDDNNMKLLPFTIFLLFFKYEN